MLKKISFFLLLFSVLFSFEPVSYDKIWEIAKETNFKLFGKYSKKREKNNRTDKISIKQNRSPNTPLIVISKKRKKSDFRVFTLPYLSFKDIVKQVIGAPDDCRNSLCRALILDKEVVESCSDVKNFIKERNKLLDEFVANFLKFKNDVIRNKIYYRGEYFNCGLLYKYYSYEHYADCDKLMNMLSQKEKQKLYDYVNFVLNN